MLSHDLFEGLFARAGLVSDVDLFEEFPSNYEVAARRNHRWVRGDWQLLPWILGFARDASGRRHRPGIPAHGRWKMIDNLRRSLSAPFSFLVLVTAWSIAGVPWLPWSLIPITALLLPPFIPVLDGLVPARSGFSRRSHLRAIGSDISVSSSQSFLAVAMLAHQAWLMADGVVRTLVRLLITRRNLLEWVTAAQAGYGVDLRLRAFFLHLRWGLILAAAAGTLFLVAKPEAWPVAAPLVLIWLLSPVVAWRISVPPNVAESQVISYAETRSLRLIARRSWRFFETFADDQENFLPPDNFQEDPTPVRAHRTSPTNMGLYLLSTTVANDFGWIGTLDTVTRLEQTMETMSGLRRHRGHFLNWYDTTDLRPLEPTYVSTVDSGNLAGHLLAISEFCRAALNRPLLGPEILDGIRDALELLQRSIDEGDISGRTQTVTLDQLREVANEVGDSLAYLPTSLPEWGSLLSKLARQAETLLDIARTLTGDLDPEVEPEILAWARGVRNAVASHVLDLETATLLQGIGSSDRSETAIGHRLAALALMADQMVDAMDFHFLFDSSRKLFSIGYRLADGVLDPNCYDLLASEARLGSFVAIAKGDVPPRHWFLLGRALTPIGRGAALVSWAGSMFEYMMPVLVMHQPARSLLDLTCRLVVRRQIQYGSERSVPWGVSESAHNVRDVEYTYQYSGFGVPGLGLRRGLFEALVVAPYATALAAMVEPKAAIENFRRLEEVGARGAFGFYEAVDFTPSSLPEDARAAVVRTYMAHHQGMSLVSLGNVVHNGRTRARFHSHRMVQAAELLLQERTPRAVAVARPRSEEVTGAPLVRDVVPPTLRTFESPHDVTPRTHVLSNGRYTVMLTAAGSGFSRWHDLAVTRWREDTTRDAWGTFFFLRDPETEAIWSAGFQPTGTEADQYRVVYSEDRARISQQDSSLSINLEVVVSPEDDAELRRLTVTNLEDHDRVIDVTSYAEVVLATQAADEAHPAFSNLFVETEFVAESEILLATRRPRSHEENRVWLAHLVSVQGERTAPLEYETDRLRFLGRGQGIRTPIAIYDGGALSNFAGTVLDPIVSLRQQVRIPRGETISLVFTTLVTNSRAETLEIAEKYRQPGTFERESSQAWTQAQVQLHHLRINQDEAHLFQRLANRLLYADPTARAVPEVLTANRQAAQGLWKYGISGDLPIAMVRIELDEERDVVRQLLRAREYWHLKGIEADLVVMNARDMSYVQDLQTTLEEMVQAIQSTTSSARPEIRGDVFLLRADLVPEQDHILLQTAARVLILAAQGTLSEQVVRLQGPRPAPISPPMRTPRADSAVVSPNRPSLQLFNGMGGFTPDGSEYVTRLGKGQWTPAPWLNVVANPGFGFQVSESGSGYTWAANSRENKLTPWSNDPVSDPPGEAFYVRDEESGLVWGPTVLPIREESSPYEVRHGQGFSRFLHESHEISLDLLQFAAGDDPVKISSLTLHNLSSRPRRLSVTAYVEWVLGVSRSESAAHVVTALDTETGAIFARNSWNAEFANRVAFADLRNIQTSWTCDRLEFLGRNGSFDHPASVERGQELSRRAGPGLDPCAALQTTFELGLGERVEVVLLMGQGADEEHTRSLVRRYREVDSEGALDTVLDRWDRVLGVVQIETPDDSFNIMLNRWLLYQTLSCRVWARAAFYQAGGAYGFRDQLQDVMALCLTEPDLVREQLLRAASRQFREGDVQHWWHPPTGRGVRTRISDDRLWLPYVLSHYLRTTEDWSVLEEPVAWLDGPVLKEGESESYFEPVETDDRATLYEHCALALDISLEVGSHGLPLIGGGDWNDGMNRVGAEGRGESVWLGWFLSLNLREFAKIADQRGDSTRAMSWQTCASSIEAAIEQEAWDGSWYRRAYFDDGTPLGSSLSDECQIDSIAQSWAVMSGAGDPGRAREAMKSVAERLIREEDKMILLFAPPFDLTPHDPGYIKGYVPGTRENGGQYTHAAVWTVMAFAMLGEGDRAFELFNFINPTGHSGSRTNLNRYAVEPYAVAADIYSQPPHTGRGGWTWYTGAAGWLYRAGLESILGFQKIGSALQIAPCIPSNWDEFRIDYRHGDSLYRVTVKNPEGLCRGVSDVSLDGVQLSGDLLVPLSDDGQEHIVEVRLGSK